MSWVDIDILVVREDVVGVDADFGVPVLAWLGGCDGIDLARVRFDEDVVPFAEGRGLGRNG